MRHDREPNDAAISPPTSPARRTHMALIAALVGILAGIALLLLDYVIRLWLLREVL